MLPLDLSSALDSMIWFRLFGYHLVLRPRVTLGIASCMNDFYWLWSPSMLPPAMLSMACYPIAYSCCQDNIPIVFQLAKSLVYMGITQWPSKNSPNILGESRNHCLPRVVIIKIYNFSINMELYSPWWWKTGVCQSLAIPWIPFILEFFSLKRTAADCLGFTL